jgi:hypothetical protein
VEFWRTYQKLGNNMTMSNSQNLTNLNALIYEIKIINGSISILDKANEDKDEKTKITSLDAINFRIREIAKLTSKIENVSFSIDSILEELSNPIPNIKKLHDSMDTQLETLRKMALSEILTLSVE